MAQRGHNEAYPVTTELSRVNGGKDCRARAMRLLAEGFNVSAVAEQVGVNRNTVMAWRASEGGKAELEAARAAQAEVYRDTVAEARAELKSLAQRAVRALAEDLDSGDAELRHKAARTILDRVGLPRTERHEVVPVQEDLSKLSDEEVEMLRVIRAKMIEG